MRIISTFALILLNITLIFISCSSTPDPVAKVDPIESALPHGAALPTTSLSPEDQIKLGNANGIVATPLDARELANLIDRGSNGLNIYCLWKLDCPECDKLLKALTELKQEIDPADMAIHHINANYLDDQDKVNSHIRSMGLINNNYILSGLEDYPNDQPYSTLFKSGLPILILANNNDGIKLIYQNAFTLEELYAIISPLTI